MFIVYRSTRIPHEQVEQVHWGTRHRQAAHKVLRAMGLRMCRGCLGIMPSVAMNPGGRGLCPPCHRASVRAWRLDNPEQARVNALLRRARQREASIVGAPVTAAGLRGKLAVWGDRCHICRSPVTPDDLEWDHVKPLSKGGLHILANLRPAHSLCNARKSATWVARA